MVKPAPHVRRSGFTLVEMLLVIAIISIVTLITIPTLRNSMRGSQLKAAARTIISSGRYARSMAVLKQQPVHLTFAVGQNVVTVTPVSSGTPRLAVTIQKPDDSAAGDESDIDSDATNAPTVGASGNETLSRTMAGIKIMAVTTEDSGDTSTIVYGTNGRCTPYSVTIQDEHDSVIVIEVDALATATTEAIQ